LVDKVRIGVIGCGGMGSALAKSSLKVSNIKILATCDMEEERAKTLASQLKSDYYARTEDLLDRSDIDGVIVATPNYTHREVAVAALQAGKNVFCEKPMALKLEDCDSMINTAQKAGLTLMIGHVMRYYSGCTSIKRAIAEGEIGQPIICNGSRTAWLEPGRMSRSWRRSKELVGDSLFEATIHEIDLMRWFAGDVDSVQASGYNFAHPELDYDDCAIAILRFRNGALGTLESGYAFRLGDHRVTVNGTKGAAQIDFKASTVKVTAESRPERIEPLMNGTFEDQLAAELQHYANCITEGKEPLTNGWEGKSAVEIATAINRSAESGRVVKIPLIH